MTRLACIFAAGIWGSAALFAQISPYDLKLETQPGVVILTFSTENGQARVYLPDDLAPGEPFAGTVEATRNFVLEFAGQSTQARFESFFWMVPEVRTGEFVPLILRSLKGQELARASIQVTAKSAPGPAAFRVPRLVQAGKFFPITGTFDGNLESTRLTVDGKTVRVLAESRRKAVARFPDAVMGLVGYRLMKKGVEKSGEIRSLAISVTNPATDAQNGGRPLFDLSVKGLAGIKEDVPLRIAQNFFYLRPGDIPADGTFAARRAFDGVAAGASSIAATLIIPQTPEEEVGIVLRTPQRGPEQSLAAQHAEALRRLDFDALPVAAGFLKDFDLGSDAALAMLALDESRALALLFASMPASGLNIERLGMTWFLDHYDFAHGSPIAADAHEAAVRLLDGPSAASSTATTDLALYIVGLTGSEKDFPLLERYYDTNSRASAIKGTHDASEGALTRLGSRKHLEIIRAELAPPLSAHPTLPEGVKLGQSLDKAGYSGRPELVHEVCSHVTDPFVLEIDIGMDPGQHALTALSAIMDKTNPRAHSAKRTLAEWVSYCQAGGTR